MILVFFALGLLIATLNLGLYLVMEHGLSLPEVIQIAALYSASILLCVPFFVFLAFRPRRGPGLSPGPMPADRVPALDSVAEAGGLAELKTGAPGLSTQPPPAQETEPLKKISAFAVAHVITARERDILLGLIRGSSRENMARELELAPRTVRHHLSNLLKKTNIPNEGSFLDYYHSWKP